MINYISKYPVMMLAALTMLLITSCQKKYPSNIDSPDEVVLKSIKIVNAGANGNTVIEGVIDENRKTVTFPRLDTLTNFDAIKFQAELSNGAVLDQETYAFEFGEGEAAKTNVIKVVNNKRFREYFVTLRLNIPVFGADFEKPTHIDYTNNSIGNPIYPDFTGQLTRWSGFDGEYVLVVARTATAPHLLKVEDLKNNAINRIPLNLTGVTGGTYTYSSGAQIKGHTYICNLTTSATSPLKIYHWASPSEPPTLIGNFTPSAFGVLGARYGDNMSVGLDENGNGFMYFGDNNGGAVNIRDILRIKVTNYTTLSDPTSIPAHPGVTAWMTMTRVESSNEYVLKGYAAPVRLVNESAGLTFALSNAAVPLNGADARIFSFNGERYLILTGAARAASDAVVLNVYNITNGGTVKEALENFEKKVDKSPVFSYSLLGPNNAAPGTQSGYYIIKDQQGNDDKLMLYAASADAGFVIIEFPKKSLDD